MSKKVIILAALFCITFIIPTGINSQEDQLVKECLTSLKSPFIAGDSSLKAFLTGEEVAEFRTTLFDGNTYRILLCSHQAGLIEFSLFDSNRNLLYTSSEYGDTGSWDFKMEGSMECIIEARLNNDLAESGMAMLIIGFKNSQSN
jgi:hypothetical protein